ncbi:MAG: hypothetical protein RR292_07690 [Christensenellaceae bacterium]
MLDLTTLQKRYFEVKLTFRKTEMVLYLLPPKLKTLKRLMNVVGGGREADEMIAITSEILSHNKTGFAITEDMIGDSLTIEELTLLLKMYFMWVKEAEQDPNA